MLLFYKLVVMFNWDTMQSTVINAYTFLRKLVIVIIAF